MKFFEFRNRGRRQRGAALVMIVFAVVGLAALSAGLMYVGLGRAKEQRGEQEKMHAEYVCQAGLSQAMYQLQRGLSGNVATQNNPSAWGTSEFWVQEAHVTPTVIRLTSVGTDDTDGARQELTVRAIPNTIWEYGAFGREFLHMDSNARVDSYNSTLGTYASQAVNGSGSDQHALGNGDIGSNGDISLDQNAHVWGDAIAGPSHMTTILGNAIVDGGTTPATEQVQLPTINVPSYPSLGNWTVNANTTLAAGNYTYDNLRIGTGRTLTINGPANIVCTNMLLRSNSAIVVNATNGPVNFYVIDDFILEQNGTIHSTTYHPIDVRMYLLSDNVINPEVNVQLDQIDLDSNTSVYGTILAPNAQVIIDSNFQMFGALMSRSLNVTSNARFHFDEALINATAYEIPTYETICWRELPYQH
jgi:type II secretory pathway pseudopilin PulG